MEHTLGTTWSPVYLFDEETIVDILYASDGYVYIATEAKIYRSTPDFTGFTELPLSGTIVTAFGGIAEVPGGDIWATDKATYWVKPVGSDTFTQDSNSALPGSRTYWNVGNNITAWPDYPTIMRMHDLGYGKQAAFTGVGSGVWVDYWSTQEAWLSGWGYEKGVRAANNSVIFCAGGSSRHTISVFKPDGVRLRGVVETYNGHSNIYGNHQGTIAVEPGTNRVWAMGLRNATEWFYQYSDDNGETWTAMIPLTFAGLNNYGRGNLKLRIPFEGHFLITHGSKAYLSTDGLATVQEIEDLDGVQSKQLYTFSPSEGKTIALLATDGGSVANLYYSVEEAAPEPYSEPKLLIRWRNNGSSRWSNYREISLGNAGDSEIIKKLRGLGQYRTRQYELVCTSKFPLTIALIEEFVKFGGGGDGSGQ